MNASAEASVPPVAESLLNELGQFPAARPTPSAVNLKKMSYTHDALLDLILANPWLDQNQLAAHFGYSPGWMSNILASDAFKAAMAGRREQIIDPELKATIKERFEGLLIQSLTVLKAKLSAPQVSDRVALEAAALGARALGVGGHAAPPPPDSDRLARLAERLVLLQSGIRERTINAEDATVVSSEPVKAIAA